MPTYDDYSEEDDRAGTPRGGRRIGGLSDGGGAAPAQRATPQRESEFVPWSRFVSANKEVSDRTAGKLQSQVRGQVDAAEKARGDAVAAQSRAIDSNYRTAQAPQFGRLDSGFAAPMQNPNRAFGQTPTTQKPQAAAWGSLMAQAPNAAAAPMAPTQVMRDRTPPPGRTVDPDKLNTEVGNGGFKTTPANVAGGKDLEAQIGADAWSKLVGDTQKAEQSAAALGSEGGVQALLGPGASKFDAALISGAGGQGFRDTAKQYGGNVLDQRLADANQGAMQRWQSLMGDLQKAGMDRDAEIRSAQDEMAQQTAASSTLDEQRKKAEELRGWLEKSMPVPPFARGKDEFADWLSHGFKEKDPNRGLAMSWATQIYGADAAKKYGQGLITQLFHDIERMTPEEYEAFKYGVVPAWMGLGGAASGANGGLFYGLGNFGQRQVTATTTNDASGLSAEDQADWNAKQNALNSYYQILAAIAAGGA